MRNHLSNIQKALAFHETHDVGALTPLRGTLSLSFWRLCCSIGVRDQSARMQRRAQSPPKPSCENIRLSVEIDTSSGETLATWTWSADNCDEAGDITST